MAINYRQIVEQTLKVKLKKSNASIHHKNGIHTCNKFDNLLPVSEKFHNDFNMMTTRFPKLLKSILKKKNFTQLRRHEITELEECLSIYKELLLYVEMKDYIKRFGLIEAIKKYGDKVKEIYE